MKVKVNKSQFMQHILKYRHVQIQPIESGIKYLDNEIEIAECKLYFGSDEEDQYYIYKSTSFDADNEKVILKTDAINGKIKILLREYDEDYNDYYEISISLTESQTTNLLVELSTELPQICLTPINAYPE